MRPEAVSNFISNSKSAQKVLKGVSKNPAVYTAASAFVFASIMRPTLIGVLPFKDKKDKQYSQASAIASGFVDLAATTALFIPLNKKIEKASTQLTGDVFQNSKSVEQFKSLTNRGLKIMALIPISLARFSLVKPLVNSLFNKGKEDNILSKNGGKTA